MDKTILIASFIFPERLDWFLNYLETKFQITKDKVFCFKNEDDESKLIVTFKLTVKKDTKVNLKDLFPNAVLIHKRGNALYTINALNKLIEDKYPDLIGNINPHEIKIDWSEYQNKLILLNNNNLNIFTISKIF
jgi:hypothetical protein